MKRLIFLLLTIGCCGPECRSESVMICTSTTHPDGRIVQAYGTGVAIGTTERGTLILTCRHNVRDNPSGVWVYHRHDWHRCGRAVLHDSEDLAVVETAIRFVTTPLAEESPIGAEVTIEGAGPAAHGDKDPVGFRGRIMSSETLTGDSGLHVCLGDSGGPVLARDADGGDSVLGIVYAVESSQAPSRRDQFRGATTRYVECRKIVTWLRTQYRCPPGGCAIRVRPRVVQPMFGFGIPTGPPQVIGEAVRVNPEPIFVPAPQPRQEPLRPIPDSAFIVGPAGPRGPAGPPGERGPAGAGVTQTQVEAVVNAWLDSNFDALRGEQGPPGISAGVDDLERRVKVLEDRKIRIVTSDGTKIVDDETYTGSQSDPIVLNIRRVTSASDGR